MVRGKVENQGGERDYIIKDTLNHVKTLGLYFPRNIGKPLKDLKQRKD